MKAELKAYLNSLYKEGLIAYGDSRRAEELLEELLIELDLRKGKAVVVEVYMGDGKTSEKRKLKVLCEGFAYSKSGGRYVLTHINTGAIPHAGTGFRTLQDAKKYIEETSKFVDWSFTTVDGFPQEHSQKVMDIYYEITGR